MQQDLFDPIDAISECTEALRFIPLTSAEKVLEARIVKPTEDGIVTWGDGFVTDVNKPLGQKKHLAEYIGWDFLDSMRPYAIKPIYKNKRFYSGSVNWIKTGLLKEYPAIYLPKTISKVSFTNHLVHQLLWEIYRSDRRVYSIDHMDGNPKNNQFNNLRVTSNNNWNTCLKKYGIPGVVFEKIQCQWRGYHCRIKGTQRLKELDAARDRIYIMRDHLDCQPSDIEAFIRRILSALAYRERHSVDAFGNQISRENLDLRIPEWLTWPVERFLRQQPALRF